MNASMRNNDLLYELYLKLKDETLRYKLLTSGEKINQTKPRKFIEPRGARKRNFCGSQFFACTSRRKTLQQI